MASIFTFEPETPRVASPWLHDAAVEDADGLLPATKLGQRPQTADGSPRRLQAEPQDGPVEYKLHLLLRSRRKFRTTSTGSHISGSKHSRPEQLVDIGGPFSDTIELGRRVTEPAPPSASTHQTRQHRLEQLTTQLLWRLQQSSPHHSSSATNIILPSLPEALPELQAPHHPAKLLHGLEESHGALYEIGVSDDGTLVGLAEDELEESLNNLRAMAACLGCAVEVLRKEIVGSCEWLEDRGVDRNKELCSSPLYVVEAFVKPYLQPTSPPLEGRTGVESADHKVMQTVSSNAIPASATEQLRVTLTGATMSGKSTLLGTLTTSTLDNGRGKARLSMLRHRHEITSGVTSSVTQELLGFKEAGEGDLDVLNYATDSVVSWIDTHVAAGGNRLAFISDSAGHPRYRRTTIRGLVGWSPHWTFLCIPADQNEKASGINGSASSSQQNVRAVVPDLDLSAAQLDLCLRLHLPMVIVMTKLDLASRSGLKSSLTRVLDSVKAAGKQAVILKNGSGVLGGDELQSVRCQAIEAAYDAVLPLLNDPLASVPIVLTSAVQGTGIATLQALLHELPIPDSRTAEQSRSGYVFHIENIYSKPAAEDEGFIVSGLLQHGQTSVGDVGVLGPFTSQELDDSEDSEDNAMRRRPSHLPASRSFPGALGHVHRSMPYFQMPGQEWRRFRVKSIRNLRLPVHTLLADQVGTLAIVPISETGKASATLDFGRIRKGMVLTDLQPQAIRSFAAEFAREDLENLAVGNHVVVYVNSVRASAKVVSARASEPTADEDHQHAPHGDLEDLASGLDNAGVDGHSIRVAGTVTAQNLIVTFSFDASKEYICDGDQVLIMPGGGPGLYGGSERGEKGLAGLDGFVGSVVETFS